MKLISLDTIQRNSPTPIMTVSEVNYSNNGYLHSFLLVNKTILYSFGANGVSLKKFIKVRSIRCR